MSYCIEYNPEMKTKYPKVKRKLQLPTRNLVILLAVFVAAFVFIKYRLYRCFIPGNPDVTVSAISTMVEKVGDGEPVKDAFYGFCREIIQNGIS